jgi:hypothetical protein
MIWASIASSSCACPCAFSCLSCLLCCSSLVEGRVPSRSESRRPRGGPGSAHRSRFQLGHGRRQKASWFRGRLMQRRRWIRRHRGGCVVDSDHQPLLVGIVVPPELDLLDPGASTVVGCRLECDCARAHVIPVIVANRRDPINHGFNRFVCSWSFCRDVAGADQKLAIGRVPMIGKVLHIWGILLKYLSFPQSNRV